MTSLAFRDALHQATLRMGPPADDDGRDDQGGDEDGDREDEPGPEAA